MTGRHHLGGSGQQQGGPRSRRSRRNAGDWLCFLVDQLLQAAAPKASREGYQVFKGTLEAADWVILVTSLSSNDFSTEDVLDLYRLRWRIELGFKRLKSLIGLKGPPGFDEHSARPYVLVRLFIILLLEPVVDGLEDSPPALAAA